MDLQLTKNGKPKIENQQDYDTYLDSLPNRRRPSGLKYDVTHQNVPFAQRLSGDDKKQASNQAMSELRNDNGRGYDGEFYTKMANNRFEDNVNYYSLKELIDVNSAFSMGHNPKINRDPHGVLSQANLNLTPAQIRELQKGGLSDKRVLSPRMIAFGTSLKQKLDEKGWTMKNVHVTGVNQEDLRFTVQSGNNQIDVLGFTPKEKDLGKFYVNGNTVFRNSHLLARASDGRESTASLIPAVEYFMEGTDLSKYQHFDVHKAKTLSDATSVGMNKDSDLKRSASGNSIRYDVSFTIGHNTPSRTRHPQSYKRQEVDQLLQPQTMTELVEQAYEKAQLSSDENEVDSLIDLDDVRHEDGSINMDDIDMDVVMRHSDMGTIMRLVHDDTEERLNQGQSIDDIRNELMYGKREPLHNEDRSYNSEAQNEGYDEDSLDHTAEEEVEVQQGSRERIANMMVGLTDDADQPLAGWMDLEKTSNKEDYEKVLRTTKRAAEEAGIRHFQGRFDNDGVLHWGGDRGTAFDSQTNEVIESEPVQFKMGQFFFPARENEYDGDGNLLRKEGVLDLRRGNGREDLRVDNYNVAFVPPTQNKSHILERMKITGLDQKMHSAIHASVKSQVLTRRNDASADRDQMYDVTRMNKAYEDMGRIDRERMDRPGVVEHLRNSFLIDKSYLNRDGELREDSRPQSKEDRDQYGQPQSIRLPLRGLEGVYDAQASSDGATLGLRGYFTEEFMDFIEENKGEKGFNFERTGQLGMLHRDNGEETPLERWVTGQQASKPLKKILDEIPNLERPDLAETFNRWTTAREQGNRDAQNEAFRELYEGTRNHRYMYASPMVRRMRGNYAQYDSPDRVLMTSKMSEVAKDIIGGPLDKEEERDRVRVGLMTAGGLTFEDSIVVSDEFAEEHGLRIGDKLADNHSNKGVIGYISGLDPNHPGYNEDAEQAFKDAEDSGYPLDMIQSPYGMTSRANMGLGQELIHSNEDRKGAITYQNGPNKGQTRGYAGEISVIVTNMDAEHKTNLYELQDLGRHRTFSYQQSLALQSHGADKTIGYILGNSEKKHADLLHYQNVLGYTTGEDNVLRQGRYGMNIEEREQEDGSVERFESPNGDKDFLVISSRDIAEYGLPEEASYMQLPINHKAYKDDNSPRPVQTNYMPILAERLRRETKSFDGEFVEHDYTMSLNRIADFGSQVEDLQMEYLLTYEQGLDDFKERMGNPELTEDDLKQLYESGDDQFMKEKANYPFSEKMKDEINAVKGDESREVMATALSENLKDYTRLTRLLDTEVNKYQNSVEKDQFGVDGKSNKQSFTRRKILSKEMRNSATAILTNDTSLELDKVGISPAMGINAGVLEPIDKESWEQAVETGNISKIHEAARGNWQTKKEAEGDKLMVWRDPVLHDGSVFAMDYRVDERLTGVSINPMMTATMGADFDGDTFGVAYIDDEEVQQEWDKKLNIRYNMMDKRNELAILNVGMDNVDYMKEWINDDSEQGFRQQVSWAGRKEQEDPSYFKDNKPKDVMNDYIQYIEEQTWRQVDEQFDVVSQYEDFDVERFDNIVENKAIRPELLSDEDRDILEQGNAIYDEAYRNVIDDYTFPKVSELTEVTATNSHNYPSRYVDIQNENTLLESQYAMAKDGAKGKEPDIQERNAPYLKNGVTPNNINSVRTAQKTKVDEIGRSGAQTLKVTDVLADYDFYRGRRRIPGAAVGMDVTETASQSILQIKHSPNDVPAALRFLKESPKLFEGHKEDVQQSDESKPVWVEFSSEMFGKTPEETAKRVGDVQTGRAPGPFEEAANGTDVALARKMDHMLANTYNEDAKGSAKGSIYADINHGVVTDRYPNFYSDDPEKMKQFYADEERIDWKSNLKQGDDYTPIDSESVYRLGMKSIFSDAGLSVSDLEVDYYQLAFREPEDSPRENAGLMRNHQRNAFENSDTLDILAKHGANGMKKIKEWNEMNPAYPKQVTETKYSQPYHVDYKNVHKHLDRDFGQAKEQYEAQKTFIKEKQEKMKELAGQHQPEEKVVGGQVYKANDRGDLNESNRDFLKQFQKGQGVPTNEQSPNEETYDHEMLKEAVRANESYSKDAVNKTKQQDQGNDMDFGDLSYSYT